MCEFCPDPVSTPSASVQCAVCGWTSDPQSDPPDGKPDPEKSDQPAGI